MHVGLRDDDNQSTAGGVASRVRFYACTLNRTTEAVDTTDVERM